MCLGVAEYEMIMNEQDFLLACDFGWGKYCNVIVANWWPKEVEENVYMWEALRRD